jgi:hypothetical protein
MSWKACPLTIALFWLVTREPCRGDFESQLLQRFQNKNQATAEKLREDVAENLARAASTGNPQPKKYLDKLQINLRQLQDDSYLSAGERASLIEQVKERVASLTAEVAKLAPKVPDLPLETVKDKQVADGDEPPQRQRRRAVAPISGAGSSAFQVTPVVSPGRRWVRLSITGGFLGFGLR